MIHRVLIAVFGLFWLVMLGLLCWSEFGGNRSLGSAASAERVWEKILTSPDPSSMSINLNGESIGWCRWTPTILDAAGTSHIIDPSMEGLIKDLRGYSLEVDGRFALQENGPRYRFSFELGFDIDRQPTDFAFSFGDGEKSIELVSGGSDDELKMQMKGAQGSWTETITRGDLQNPEQLMTRLGGPLAGLIFKNISGVFLSPELSAEQFVVEWSARNDHIVLAGQEVRAYRLETKLFDRYPATASISRVGEVLHVELPLGLEFVNDEIARMIAPR